MTTPLLICDDSNMARKQVARSLPDNWDVDISFATNGAEAIEAIKAGKGDVLLLDLNMPVMDGLSFLKSLRAEPNGERPVVVFCTAERSVEKITEALDAGADEYVMKPFDSDIIESKFFQAGLLEA